MIARKLLSMGILGALAMPLLTGCGATTKIMQLEIRDMKNRMAQIETEFGRQQEVLREMDAREKAAPPVKAEPVANNWSAKPAAKPAPRKLSTRDVQKALWNAGANPGPIDGKMGRRTRAALRTFQSRNSLSVTGRIDTGTKNALRNHL